ncbi:MAG TPA: zinc ribbon domain-containing protein [bacterium]|nr:zinc ribbon domain-containing protein [bacterium]
MKCPRCGFKNDAKAKFCAECGAELSNERVSEQQAGAAGLIGQEVQVLFYNDSFTGKIGGIVSPTPEQVGRYKNGVVQKVVIQAANAEDETVGTVLTFIKQSKEYLGEDYNENAFKGFSHAELKKEYLKLFERVLKMKAQRGIGGPPPPTP